MKRDCKPYRVWSGNEPRDLEAHDEAEVRSLARLALNDGALVDRVELLPDEVREYHVLMHPADAPAPSARIRGKSSLEALRIVNAMVAMVVPSGMAGSIQAVDARPIL